MVVRVSFKEGQLLPENFLKGVGCDQVQVRIKGTKVYRHFDNLPVYFQTDADPMANFDNVRDESLFPASTLHSNDLVGLIIANE